MAAIIAVAGMMGSGKSTLARTLAASLNWDYVPRNTHATGFLPDLFRDQSRWAFEAQAAFLIAKSLDILESVRVGRSIVVDRSVAEDAAVFAKHFFDIGKIDKRSFDTYTLLVEHFTSILPSPWITIYCHCTFPEIERRLESRSSGFQAMYPPRHLASIFQRYSDWCSTATDSPLFLLDTEKWDCHEKDVVRRIIADLSKIQELSNLSSQPSLFDDPTEANGNLDILDRGPQSDSLPGAFVNIGKARFGSQFPDRPTIYLAAPFSGMDTEQPDGSNNRNFDLFGEIAGHGVIPKGRYRIALLSIERFLKRMRLNTIIPHRDVNKWGKKTLSPDKALSGCTEQVRAADGIILLPGYSNGVHYEFGLARGLNKPALLVHCREIPSSFMANGVRDEEGVLVVRCDKLADVTAALQSQGSLAFIRKHFLRG